jgi:hypothetical protein
MIISPPFLQLSRSQRREMLKVHMIIFPFIAVRHAPGRYGADF